MSDEATCPICGRPVAPGYPESVEYGDERVHVGECQREMERRMQAKAKGWNPNNSYT
jgi:hypothetical protein